MLLDGPLASRKAGRWKETKAQAGLRACGAKWADGVQTTVLFKGGLLRFHVNLPECNENKAPDL